VLEASERGPVTAARARRRTPEPDVAGLTAVVPGGAGPCLVIPWMCRDVRPGSRRRLGIRGHPYPIVRCR